MLLWTQIGIAVMTVRLGLSGRIPFAFQFALMLVSTLLMLIASAALVGMIFGFLFGVIFGERVPVEMLTSMGCVAGGILMWIGGYLRGQNVKVQ
jgi:hypothetical protein